jgi:O-antigen/teichoic acid export membrane protein
VNVNPPEAARVERPSVAVQEAPAVTPRLVALRTSPTAKAAGLAAATMAGNLIAVAFTVVFTRLLGAGGYGSLAALLNLTVILFVPGAALQVAAAREGTLGRLGRGGELAGTLSRWTRRLLAGLAAVAVVSIIARAPLAGLLNVDQQWAAAAVPPTAALWLLLSIQRGLLQASQAYKAVGLSVVLEAAGRLAAGLVLVGAGLDVTGAYLGTMASLAFTAVALSFVLRRRLGPPVRHAAQHRLRALARRAAVPISALTLVAALQNVDVIMAKHVLPEDPAGVYAASTVAAKAVLWLAIGVGLWVLPEATRRAASGEDPRAVLLRALGLVGAIAAVALVAYATVPGLVLRVAFGSEYESGDTILLALGAAYTLLAAAYLAVQFLLALHQRMFIAALAVAAAVELAVLANVDRMTTFAVVVLAVQAGTAAVLLAAAARR